MLAAAVAVNKTALKLRICLLGCLARVPYSYRPRKKSPAMAYFGCLITADHRDERQHLLYKLSLSSGYGCHGSLHSSYEDDHKPIRVDSAPTQNSSLCRDGGHRENHIEDEADVAHDIPLESDEECEREEASTDIPLSSVRVDASKEARAEPLDTTCASPIAGRSVEHDGNDAAPICVDAQERVVESEEQSDEVSPMLRCNEEVEDAASLNGSVPSAESTTISEGTRTALEMSPSSDSESEFTDESQSFECDVERADDRENTIAEIAVITEGSPDPGLMLADDDGEAIFRESRGLRLKSGAAMIPHPSKVKRGGEDAYFISDDGRWLGVADGVGGWAQMGIDAGLYSRELMTNSLQAVRASNSIEPSDVLIHAHSRTHAVGSSTALLASLDGSILKFANIGDCGFLVISNGRVVEASTHMQHAFNFPYQIGTRGDDPAEAERYEVDVKEGNILVMGSDGLFDNLFHEEISLIASESKKRGESPQVAAEHIARLAQQRASRTEGVSPFAVAAMFAGFRFEGGKMDDITVVVAYLEK